MSDDEQIELLSQLVGATQARGNVLLVGLTGSVAAGKTHLANDLAESIRSGDHRCGVVATDSFLRSNAELGDLGLGMRKGFPESYDRAALAAFLTAAATSTDGLSLPVYDHFRYDIDACSTDVLDDVDVLIIEGLCLLGPGATTERGPIGDLLDLRIFLDAAGHDLQRWFTERFVEQAERARHEPGGFWDLFASLDGASLADAAAFTWDEINAVNLREHIEPGRADADVVVTKGGDHSISSIVDRRT